MPAAQPSTVQLLIKSHKLTVFLPTPDTSTISVLKTNVLSALLQFSDEEYKENQVPRVTSEEDFEICRNVRMDYKLLPPDGKKSVKELGLENWEALYLRFRVSGGKLAEVNVIESSIHDMDEGQGDY